MLPATERPTLPRDFRKWYQTSERRRNAWITLVLVLLTSIVWRIPHRTMKMKYRIWDRKMLKNRHQEEKGMEMEEAVGGVEGVVEERNGRSVRGIVTLSAIIPLRWPRPRPRKPEQRHRGRRLFNLLRRMKMMNRLKRPSLIGHSRWNSGLGQSQSLDGTPITVQA